MSSILITGASGLIGSNVVDHFLRKGFRVIGFSKSFPLQEIPAPHFIDGNYIPIVGDIRDRALLRKTFQIYRPFYLIHLAAQAIVPDAKESVEITFETNIRGTWTLLEVAREYGKFRRLVIASSDKAYGKSDSLPYEENFSLNAVHPYDISKKITEEIALSYFHSYGLPVVITRCGNVFGPYDLNASRIVPGTIVACLQAKPIVLRGDGKQERCYVYSKDVAEAYWRLISSPSQRLAGQAFNIGNDRAVSVIQIVSLICGIIGADPSCLVLGNGATDEIERQALDCKKIRNVVGWEERYPLDQAMIETITWYRDMIKLPMFGMKS